MGEVEMQPLVSIILTSYNKPWFVGKAIQSILEQTMSNWELLIMDDHSNEETTTIIEQFIYDPRIIYRNSQVKEEARFKTTRYATLINEAISLSSGKYLTYLTDDTIYLPDRLMKMTDFLEENNDIDIVFSSQLIKVVDEEFLELYEFKREANKILPKASDIVDHCSVMHTRKIAEKVYEQYGSYWDDRPLHWIRGDAVFWERLNQFQPFHPIKDVLDITYKTPNSVQTVFSRVPNWIPNGMLVRGEAGDIYLIENGTRRYLSNDMMIFYKYDAKRIIPIPDLYLRQYQLGQPFNENTIPNQRLCKDENENIFFMEQNQKRKITHSLILKKYKFNQHEIIENCSKVLHETPPGPDISSHFDTRLPESKLYILQNQYWMMNNGMLHQVDKKVLEKLKLLNNPIYLPRHILKYQKIGPTITASKYYLFDEMPDSVLDEMEQ